MPSPGKQPGCFSCFKGSETIADGPASVAAPAPVFTKHPSKPVTIPHQQLLPYLQQHGSHILAQSTLQPGVHHFLLPGVGYMAYGFKNCGPPALRIRSPVVLGDPVADPAHWQMMAQTFLKRWPDTMFLQVSRPMAQVLTGLGLYANAMGGTTDLDPATYTFSGNAKRGIRSAMSSAVKAGVEVEVLPSITPSLSAELREVDAAWLAARPPGAGRMWFLNRPPVFEDEPGVVVVAAWTKSTPGDDGVTRSDKVTRTMQAWVAFDPVWDSGRVTGYYANVTRMRPDAHPGVLNLIMRTFLSRVAASQSAAAGGHKQQRLTRKQRAAAAAAAAAADVSNADLVIDVYSSSAAGSDAVSEGSSSTPRGTAAAAAAGSGGSTNGDSSLTAATSFANTSSARLTSSSSNATTSSFSSFGTGAAAAAEGSTSGTGVVTGVRMVSLGLSPLHALKDDLHHSSRFKDWLEWGFEHGEPFYPYKSLAASKAKYGGGMAEGQYKDPTVQYNQTYWCHKHHVGCCVPLYDVIQWMGLATNPAQAGAVLAAHKVKQLVKDARARRQGLTPGDDGLGEELPSFMGSSAGSTSSSAVPRSNSSNSSSSAARKQQPPKAQRPVTAAAAGGDGEEVAKPAVALVVPKGAGAQQQQQQLPDKLATSGSVARKLSQQLVVVASSNPGVLV